MRPAIAAVALLAVFTMPVQADETAAMQAAAEGFYGAYGTFRPSDGIPDAADFAKYRPFLSPRLGDLLAEAGAAEARYTAKYKDSPPLVEGDLFTSLFEGASTVSVRGCAASGAGGQCTAHLSYAPPGTKPTSWSDTVYLVQTPAGWRVDDIGYGGAWDFANKGRLSETLGQAIHFQ